MAGLGQAVSDVQNSIANLVSQLPDLDCATDDDIEWNSEQVEHYKAAILGVHHQQTMLGSVIQNLESRIERMRISINGTC
jgi:hypothetical protein